MSIRIWDEDWLFYLFTPLLGLNFGGLRTSLGLMIFFAFFGGGGKSSVRNFDNSSLHS